MNANDCNCGYVRALKLTLFAAAMVAVASSAWAGGDRCPHWISVMPLASDDAEAIAADAAKQGDETIVDGIA